MTKEEALALIDNHKNKLTDPIEHLNWVWLRVFLLQIDDNQWDVYMGEVAKQIGK